MGDDGFDGTELDFWLGDWDVTWEGGRGTNRPSRILRDRVILEEFDESVESGGEDALHGRSWSVFDPDRRLWRQTWVDSTGSYLDFVGARAEGWLTFERDAPERGDHARQRMVFRDVEAARFRWTWELSSDGGTTWETRWEINYRRRTQSTDDPHDEASSGAGRPGRRSLSRSGSSDSAPGRPPWGRSEAR